MTLVEQSSPAPTRKIKAVIASGVITSLVVAAGLIFGVDIPAEDVDVAVGSIVVAVNAVTAIAGYFTKSRS